MVRKAETKTEQCGIKQTGRRAVGPRVGAVGLKGLPRAGA